MSEAVDTRIVEAKFDSSQFEKGVDRTVKKLDELKKSMTFEETGKSIADLTSKAQEATEKASNSLEKLENRITSFTGMLKQKLLGGIADEIVGAIFKVKNSIEGLVKSLSTSQISTGMYKYEQMLTSVRTMIAAGDTEKSAYKAIGILGQYADQTSYSLDQMTSALSKMRAAGVDLETGTKAVEGISNACAAAGVNATDASRAFYNLSQAYSSGYLRYTDYRSLELLNMTTENFKKQMLEAAEAAGTLQKVSDGVYKTINKNDKKVKAGKRVTEKTLTEALRYNIMNTEAMNLLFGEKYFFDEEKWNEIKEEFKDIADEDKREQKVLEVAKERYGEIAVNAYFAAREARSFTDVLNTLKDVVSRGWATSFELIFGRLEDAKKFFTWLAESDLANAIYAISDFRNKVLETWADDGGREAFMDALKKIDELLGKILGNFTIFGSDTEAIEKKAHNLGDSLYQSTLRLRDNIEKISKWLTEPLDDKGTTRIERIGKVFKTLGKVISGASRVIAIGMKFIGNLFVLLAPVFDSFEGILEKVTNALLNLTDPINDNKGAYKGLENGLSNILKIAEPFVSVLSTVLDVLGDVAAFFVDIATGTFAANIEFFSDILGFVLELFGKKSAQAENGVGVIEGIKNDIVSLGEACKDALGFVGEFFENLFKDLGKLFGLKDETDTTEQGGFFSNIINFFDSNEFIQKAKAWIDQAIIDIGNFIKSIPDRIVELANNLWDTVNGILWNKDYSENTYQNIKKHVSAKDAESYKESMKTPFYKFVEGLINTVKDFIISLPETIADLVGKAGNFITDVINGIFDFFTKEQDYSGSETDVPNDVIKDAQDGLETGFDHIKNIVVNFVKSLPEKIWNALKTIGTTALNIGNKIWKFIDELIFGKVAYTKNVYNKDTKTWKKITVRYKKGFSKWLDDTVKSIKDFFTNPEKIKEIWNKIVDFFFGRQATEEDTKRLNPKTGKNYKLTDRVKEGFSEWLDNTITAVKDWILTIPGKISNIWNMIIDFIFGREATEADFDTQNPVTGENYKPTERVKEGFSLWIHDIWTKIKTWFTSGQILKDIEGIWNKVVDFIFGKEQTFTVVKPETGEEHQVTMRVKEGFSKWLDDTIKAVKDWLGTVNDKIRNIWNTVLDAIFDTKESNGFSQEIYDKLLNYDSKSANKYKEYYTKKSGIITQIDEWLKSLGIDIGKMISNLPTYIAEGWNFSVDLFGDLLGHVEEWLDKKTLEAEAKKTAKDGAEAVDKAVSDAAAEEDQTGFFKVIVEIGQKIKGMITETIPSILKKAWPVLKDESKNLISAARGIFERLTVGDLSESAQNAANNIAETIKNMPSYIRKAIKTFKNLFTSSDFDMTKTGKKLEMPLPSVEYSEEEFKKLLASGKVKIEHLKKDLTKTVTEEVSDDSGVGFSLWGSIKDIGSAIGEAIGAFGPDILAGVNKAFEWINSQISNFTQKLAEKPDDTPFFEWLTGLIGGKDKQSSGLATVVQNIGTTLKTLIIETIPNFLGEAFAELAAGIPRFIKSIFGGENTEVETAGEEVGKKIGDEVGESVAQSMLSGYKEVLGNNVAELNSGGGLLDWFVGLFVGSASAEDSEGRFSEVSDQIDDAIKAQDETAKKATEMINRQEKIKEIEEKYNEAEAMRADAMNLGKNDDIIRLTNNIIVYEAQLKKLREAEGDLVEASILDNTGKIQEAREASTDFFTSFKEILGTIGSFANSNVIGTIAIIAGVVYALHAIKDMLSVTDEIEGIGYTAKWEAVKIAIIGIVAMLGWISYLSAAAANNPDDKRLDKTIETLTKIGDFFERLAGVLVTFAGLSLGKEVAESIGDIASIWATAKGGGWTSTLLKVLGGAAGIAAGPWIGEKAGDSIAKLFEGISDTFVSIGEGVDGMVSLISPAISGLAELDVKLDAAISAVGKTWDLIQAFYKLIGIVGISVAGTDEATKQFMENASMLNTGQPDSAAFIADALERRMLFLTELTTMMNNLSNSLKTMSEIENPQEQIEKMLGVVQSFEFVEFIENAVDALYDAVSNTFGTNLADLNYVAIGFDMLADALSIFGDGISSLNVDNVKALDETLDVFSKIGAAFANVADNKTGLYELVHHDKALSSFAKEIKLFGTYIKSYFTSISALSGTTGDEAEFERTQRRIEMIIQIAQGMAKAASELGGYSAEKIAELGESLSSSGDKFGAFLTGLNTSLGGEIDVDRIHVLGEIAGSLGQMMAGVGTLAMGASGKSDKIPEYISQFMTGIMQSFTGEEDLYTVGLTAGTRLDAGVADGINTGLAISAVKTLADAIEMAINGQDIKPKITPVLEITDDFTNKVNTIRQMLGYNPMQEVNGVLDMSWRLADAIKIPEQYDYTEKLDTIIEHMGVLNNSVSEFNDSMSNMTIAVDGEELGTTIYPFVEKAAGWNLVTNQRPGVDE